MSNLKDDLWEPLIKTVKSLPSVGAVPAPIRFSK